MCWKKGTVMVMRPAWGRDGGRVGGRSQAMRWVMVVVMMMMVVVVVVVVVVSMAMVMVMVMTAVFEMVSWS